MDQETEKRRGPTRAVEPLKKKKKKKHEYMWFCCGSCKCVFRCSITKMENTNLKQYYGIKFGLSYGRALRVPMKRFRKPLVIILCHMLKFFSGTETS
jgi:hypothetical protein